MKPKAVAGAVVTSSLCLVGSAGAAAESPGSSSGRKDEGTSQAAGGDSIGSYEQQEQEVGAISPGFGGAAEALGVLERGRRAADGTTEDSTIPSGDAGMSPLALARGSAIAEDLQEEVAVEKAQAKAQDEQEAAEADEVLLAVDEAREDCATRGLATLKRQRDEERKAASKVEGMEAEDDEVYGVATPEGDEPSGREAQTFVGSAALSPSPGCIGAPSPLSKVFSHGC
jgi:hypothetical protein